MIHCENNVAGDLENKESIKVLTDTAETISACGKNIQKTIESINQSCNTPGTKGATHKSQLQVKVEEMKKLAVLHSIASKKLISAASKITNGMPEDAFVGQ